MGTGVVILCEGMGADSYRDCYERGLIPEDPVTTRATVTHTSPKSIFMASYQPSQGLLEDFLGLMITPEKAIGPDGGWKVFRVPDPDEKYRQLLRFL